MTKVIYKLYKQDTDATGELRRVCEQPTDDISISITNLLLSEFLFNKS
jgi:hypothetical protein